MKSNELRIGNLVETDFSEGNIKTVVEIKHKMASVKYIRTDTNEPHQSMVDYERLVPIELTEEWLKKAGFEKDDTGVDMFDQDYYEWYQKEFPTIGVLCQSSDKSYLFDENTDTIRIKYVHQLQNLHFAICGEELVFSSTEP